MRHLRAQKAENEFLEFFLNDPVGDLKFFDKIVHPIFSNEMNLATFNNYDVLQLSVLKGEVEVCKDLIKRTNLKTLTLCANGNNLLHVIVKNKISTGLMGVISKKMVKEIEEHNEANPSEPIDFLKDFLEIPSAEDGLSVLEYASGSQVYAPFFF